MKKNKLINILFIFPYTEKGGAQKSFVDIIKNLDKKKFNIYIICQKTIEKSYLIKLKKAGEKKKKFPLPYWNNQKEVKNIIRFRQFISNLFKSGFHLLSITRILNKIKEWNIDLVYTNGAITLDGALASELVGKPHIWHIRELIGADKPCSFLIGNYNAIKLISKLSKAVIVNSKATKEPFDNFKITNSTVIYNGFDINEYSHRKRTYYLNEKLGLERKNILLGYLSNYAKWKNQKDLIKIAYIVKKENKNIKFLLIGIKPKNTNSYFNSLASLVKKLDLEDTVYFLEFQENIVDIIKDLDVIATTSLFESFGRTIMEGMLMNKIVVSYNAEAPSELINNNKTGFLIEKGNILQFASRIVKIANNLPKYAAVKDRARKYAEKKFNIKNIVNQLEDLFISLA